MYKRQGVTNGNSRGQENDTDKSKHAYLRLEKDFKNDLKFGVNGGIGSYTNKTGDVIGGCLLYTSRCV